MFHVRRFVLFFLLCLTGAGATLQAAEIHKCRSSDGKVAWSDRPCPDGAHTETTRTAVSSNRVAGLQARCADTGLEWRPGDALDGLDRSALTAKQRDAWRKISSSLAYTRPDSIRWRHTPGGDLRLCATGVNGRHVEMVLAADGRVVQFVDGRGKHLNDPRHPAAVQAGCSKLAAACFDPDDSVGIDDCIAAIPACGAAGGDCCPPPCQQAYGAAREAGTDPMSAVNDVLFGEDSCVPGMRELLQGK